LWLTEIFKASLTDNEANHEMVTHAEVMTYVNAHSLESSRCVQPGKVKLGITARRLTELFKSLAQV